MSEQIFVGDHVRDIDDPEGATMVVVALPTENADEYEIGEGKTVHDYNQEYPADDDVICVTYPSRTCVDMDALKEYAFPKSRLDVVAPVHDREDDIEGPVEKVARHIVSSHTAIDDRLTDHGQRVEDLERRMDRAERDLDTIDGGL